VRRTGKLLVVLALLASPAMGALAAPSPAPAASAVSAYQQVLRVYEANGAIAPCRFSSPQLERALSGLDTYGAQYFADFTNAISAALTARAAGQCGPAPARPRAPAGGTASDVVARLPSVTAPTSAGVPLPLIVLAALAVAGAAGGGVALARAAGRSPRDRHRAADDVPA
jgi:hypothetical protein